MWKASVQPDTRLPHDTLCVCACSSIDVAGGDLERVTACLSSLRLSESGRSRTRAFGDKLSAVEGGFVCASGVSAIS
jgi:hypothetical protein